MGFLCVGRAFYRILDFGSSVRLVSALFWLLLRMFVFSVWIFVLFCMFYLLFGLGFLVRCWFSWLFIGFLCFVLVFRILIDSILFSGLGYFVCLVFLIFPLIGFLMLVLVFLVVYRFSFGVFGFLCYFA